MEVVHVPLKIIVTVSPSGSITFGERYLKIVDLGVSSFKSTVSETEGGSAVSQSGGLPKLMEIS